VGQQGAFRVAFAPGVTPDKWLGIWKEREHSSLDARLVEESDQLAVLRAGTADMCFVRLPVDREGLHVIPLYREATVVVLPVDHLLTVLDEVAVGDLADEQVLEGADLLPGWAGSATAAPLEMPPMTTKQAIEVAASGTGIVVVPMSVARLHARKDVTTRAVVDATESQIGLAWRTDLDDPRVEAFVGIVRGRTARSTRGGDSSTQPEPEKRASSPRPPRKAPGRSGRTPLSRKRRPR
jgi:DNA-binding transcriptional LysR family regulator